MTDATTQRLAQALQAYRAAHPQGWAREETAATREQARERFEQQWAQLERDAGRYGWKPRDLLASNLHRGYYGHFFQQCSRCGQPFLQVHNRQIYFSDYCACKRAGCATVARQPLCASPVIRKLGGYNVALLHAWRLSRQAVRIASRGPLRRRPWV